MTDAQTVSTRPTGSPSGNATRKLGRIALALVIVGSLALTFQPPGGRGSVQSADGSTLYITLREGDAYGEALGQVGSRESTPVPISDAHFAAAVREALSATDSPAIVLRVSGGVRQGELQRVRSLLARTIGKRTIPVTLWMWEESLRDAASPDGSEAVSRAFPPGPL